MTDITRRKSTNISTHALTEGDSNVLASIGGSVFQLTPSRRATSGFFSVALIVFNFNSRPHGGRRGRSEMPYDNAAFQLTPSRRATREHFCFPCRTAFQLTPSRRATIIEASAHRAEVISTHALTEGDRKKR